MSYLNASYSHWIRKRRPGVDRRFFGGGGDTVGLEQMQELEQFRRQEKVVRGVVGNWSNTTMGTAFG